MSHVIRADKGSQAGVYHHGSSKGDLLSQGNELDVHRDHHLVKGVRRDNSEFIGKIPTIKSQGIVRSEGGKETAQTGVGGLQPFDRPSLDFNQITLGLWYIRIQMNLEYFLLVFLLSNCSKSVQDNLAEIIVSLATSNDFRPNDSAAQPSAGCFYI